MNLTKKERLSFIYQLRILEALYPSDAPAYARDRTALEEGYALHYSWMTNNLSKDLSEKDCGEVLDILDMYRALTFSLKDLPKNDKLHTHHLAKFRGFDGNNEGQLMGYVRYLMVDLDRFDELKQEGSLTVNSHTPMLDTYRTMLERWKETGQSFDLSPDNIAHILGRY